MAGTRAYAHYVTVGSEIRSRCVDRYVADELRVRGDAGDYTLLISKTGVGSGATAMLRAPLAPFRCTCHHTGRPYLGSHSPFLGT